MKEALDKLVVFLKSQDDVASIQINGDGRVIFRRGLRWEEVLSTDQLAEEIEKCS